ncbi:MAG: hypothetical protein MUF48_14860 [Pirellulaceae bacterium]|nr:hypothetical protein [Pirellulaceae bacterium]
MSYHTQKRCATRPRGASPSCESVSDKRRLLLLWIQHIYDGRIENIRVRAGEPFEYSSSAHIATIDFRSWSSLIQTPEPLPESEYLTHEEVQRLLDYFDEAANCEIASIEIEGGLPVRINVRR